jgi:hypothetical protein
MRAVHAVLIPIILFGLYLALNYLVNPVYDNASLSDFMTDNIKTIMWSCIIFFLGMTFDFLRRATHTTNYRQVNGDYFLWSVTIALVFQLILAAGHGVLLMNGTPRLIGLLNGHETAILLCVIGAATLNTVSYAIGVDMNS